MGIAADSLIVPECVYRPGSFTGLMTLYESNYVKLATLIKGFGGLCAANLHSSVSVSDCNLYLELIAAERYTTTINLTYRFAKSPSESEVGDMDVSRIADPDLAVRIYHDARLVEATGGSYTHRHHKLLVLDSQFLGQPHSLELDRRWRINMMLNKWLDYLLESGHGFA